MPVKAGQPFSFDQSIVPEMPAGEPVSEGQARVIIIGAGLAGLSCAFRLSNGGKRRLTRQEVTVLESESQPGGRVRSMQLDSTVINLGALTFQPEHYPRYNQLINELGLSQKIRWITRKQMLFGVNGTMTRVNDASVLIDSFKGIFGKGVFTPFESLQLLRFFRTVKKLVRNESELTRLHEMSLSEWVQAYGFSSSLQWKFVRPLSHFSFSGPEDISAAFGLFLLGFNLSRPATLEGGMGQIADHMADHLQSTIKTNAKVLRIEREADGFSVLYTQGTQSRLLHGRHLVVAVPATVASRILPQMAGLAEQTHYGTGSATMVKGRLRSNLEANLYLQSDNGSAGDSISGGESRKADDGDHYLNVLHYGGSRSMQACGRLFEGDFEEVVHYDIKPASAVPRPRQAPPPMDWGDGLYLAGDCTGMFPSQETAVSSGETVAARLSGALSN